MSDTQKTTQPPQAEDFTETLSHIDRVLLVLSGKGGVGKSTVAVTLATSLAGRGYKVGLLDIDVHGPSVPGMLGLSGAQVMSDGERIMPVEHTSTLKLMSVGFLTQSNRDAVIWRGPMKYNVIKQLLSDVAWGELDFLIVDSPPGTGDEPLNIVKFVGEKGEAIVVTTPQKVAVDDVRRSISFCHTLKLPITGVLENMSGYRCPNCGTTIFPDTAGAGKLLAEEMEVPFLGAIPFDPSVMNAGDAGSPFDVSGDPEASKAYTTILDTILGNNERT